MREVRNKINLCQLHFPRIIRLGSLSLSLSLAELPAMKGEFIEVDPRALEGRPAGFSVALP